MGVIEGSRAMLGCPVRYMDVTEVSWVKLWCSVCYTWVMEGSRAKAGEPSGVHGRH
jgi:hypothetical protein